MINRKTIFSPCRTYRYALWREGLVDEGPRKDQYAMFIGLNPSTADETKDDPTIRRCIGYARSWGYGALCMTNLFAYRATDPGVMKRAPDPVGPHNNEHLLELAAGAGVVVAAWGTHGTHMCRDDDVWRMMSRLHYLSLTKHGHPSHPLRLSKALAPQPWERKCKECGCTDDDCRGCIQRTGSACYWLGINHCSACLPF